ncbi:hypothetical protein CYMTET_9107 [Cymbomonas tetramitiformis]|uniref:Uncharacterized protein n=1 Tax=Cymbomonas tetramitiformis TaxID=36881 RepID=A0AAE0GS43_9CHLO|nr:hypothetical protein CYMTET_9107 [Cymbomonas tetramitiformis]
MGKRQYDVQKHRRGYGHHPHGPTNGPNHGPTGTVPQARAAEAGGQNHHAAQPAIGGATSKPSPPADSPYKGILYREYTIPKRWKKAEGGPAKKKKTSATEEEFHSPQLTIVTRQACKTKRQVTNRINNNTAL